MTPDIAILTTLDNVAPRLMPEAALIADARLLLGPDATAAIVRLALQRLDRVGHIIGIPNEDTGTRWQLSDSGKARLLQALS